MTYNKTTTYEFTAFTEADFLEAGADGYSLSCGDTFTMPTAATTCFEVTDNDRFLSGDSCRNENANDYYGQQAAITDAETGEEIGNGGQIYAEKYWVLHGSDGQTYYLIEIEQERGDAPGAGDDYFTFYGNVPPAGTDLTVSHGGNVTGNWVDFKCLDAGEKGPVTGSISGTVFCDIDCDGIQDGETTFSKGDNIFTDSVTFESVNCTTYNVDSYGSWYSVGADVIDLVVGGAQGHKGNAYDNTLVELDKGGVWCRQFSVEDSGTYCLQLDVYKNSCVGQQGNTFLIKVNGVTVEQVTVTEDGKVEVSLDLLAGGNRIDFVSLSDVKGYGAGIDDIELLPLIETTTITEPGKEGVVVVLLDANGDEVLDGNGDRIETVTDENGDYQFDGVPVGDYRVKFENPDGTEFTFQNVGDDDTIDSDVDANGVSDVVSVAAGETTSDVDAGLKPAVELGSIAGRYFCDENKDGAETDGAGNFEAGVAGATVWLLLGGNVIASTTTDDDGNYIFEGLEAGNYSVRFEDPDDVSAATEGKAFIAADQGDDATDSDVVTINGAGDGDTATITLAAGENKTDVDGGIEQQFMVCDDPDAVLIDFEGLDGDVGFEAFEAGRVIDNEYAQFGVTITAQRASNNDPANDAMVFDSANPTGGDPDLQTFNQGNLLIVSEDNDSSDPDDAVGGVITFDFENPSRIFDLKVVDTEEGGTIELFDADGNSLGVIDLPNLADGGLEQVMIDTDGVSQMVVTLNGSGAIDDICIVPGQPEPGSLSGRYFFDADRDGLDNDGANGISGIQVELLDENGVGTGIIETTDGQGNYSFGGLDAGAYGVKFTDPDTGRELTTQNVDMDASDDIDSDAADIGGGMSVINGIVVVAGADTPDNDAGVVQLLGSLSGRYFCDDDGDGLDNDGPNGGLGEGVEGIRVTLIDANDRPMDLFTFTAADGSYSFTDLVPGVYDVSFETTPPGKRFTTQNVDNDVSDDIDSDAMADDFGMATITGIVVVGGQDTPDNDVGVTPSNQDPEAEDVMAAVCADETATINLLFDVTDPDGDTVQIASISDADETAGVGGSITLAGGGVVTLNADGTATFDPNGAYDNLEIRDMAMDQFQFTAADGNGGSDTATADIKICGALNTIETIAEGFVDAGGDPLQASYNVDPAFGPVGFDFLNTVTADAPLDPRLEAILGPDGVETFDDDLAYCVDLNGLLEFGVDVPSNLYIVGDDAMNTGNSAIATAVDQEENLDIVTWILNQGFQSLDAGTLDDGDINTLDPSDEAGRNYTFNEVQDAIWFFTDGQTVDPQNSNGANTQEIIDLATVAGEGFVAGEDDVVAVLFDPIDEDRQTYIVGVEFNALEEECDCIL